MAPATMLAIIDLTAGEIMIILVVGLIVLGPERLPEVARTLGQWMAKARKMTGHLQAEMREVLDDPSMQPLKDVGEFVAQPRKKLTEMALAAEAEAAARPVPAPPSDPAPVEATEATVEDGTATPEPRETVEPVATVEAAETVGAAETVTTGDTAAIPGTDETTERDEQKGVQRNLVPDADGPVGAVDAATVNESGPVGGGALASGSDAESPSVAS